MILINNLITENPLATMKGPDFLVVYILFILMVYAIGYYLKIGNKKKFTTSVINVSSLPNPDPILIAFLRAGVSETTKIVIYDLFERGYLRTSPKKKNMGQRPGHPPLENLNELEKTLFEHVGHSKSIEDVVDYLGMLSFTNTYCLDKVMKSDYKELYFGEDKSNVFNSLKWGMRACIILFGGYKFIMALSTHHYDVLFLLLLMVIGTLLVKAVLKPPRLTIAGEKYLKDLRSVYAPKYSNGIKTATYNYKLLLIGIFGISLLNELGYNFMVDYIKVKNIEFSSSGSCGSSSCSGGSSCGGGCGGGCGGCGS